MSTEIDGRAGASTSSSTGFPETVFPGGYMIQLEVIRRETATSRSLGATNIVVFRLERPFVTNTAME